MFHFYQIISLEDESLDCFVKQQVFLLEKCLKIKAFAFGLINLYLLRRILTSVIMLQFYQYVKLIEKNR